LLDRTRTQAWGLNGGGGGASARLLVKRKGQSAFTTFDKAFGTASATKFTRVVLRQGDEVLIESPGGGGYGRVELRSPEAVERDLRQGYSSAAAERDGDA
jgi:N-methylhydantoinase B/oxoprolinase/acetone carboxylase alpha subunit